MSLLFQIIIQKLTSFLKFLNVKWKKCPTFRLSNFSEIRENGKISEFNCSYLIIVFGSKKIRVKNIQKCTYMYIVSLDHKTLKVHAV